MSILRARLTTNAALWGVISTALFVLVGFVDLAPDTKGSASYWGLWVIFLSGDWICSAGEFVSVLSAMTAVLAVPSMIGGWVLQAIVVAVIAAVRGAGRE